MRIQFLLETHNSYLYPSLISSCFTLVDAMRAHFHRDLSSTEDDGGVLQWDLTSRCWICYTKSAEFPQDFSHAQKSGALSKGLSPGVSP